MKVSHYLDAKPSGELPGVTMRVVIGEDDGAPNFKMRVFELEPGSSTPFHTHNWEHEIFILSGRGVAVSEQGETPITSGNVVFIPANEKHCLTNKGNEVFRFICLIPIVD